MTLPAWSPAGGPAPRDCTATPAGIASPHRCGHERWLPTGAQRPARRRPGRSSKRAVPRPGEPPSDAAITSAMADSPGWPGGGWITYRLTGGPDAGKMVYLAEDVTPAVSAGEHVTAGTVIARMYDGGAGIETGWATPDGSTALSQAPEAGGISGGGPFPTAVGASFDGLLTRLGVPAAPNAGQPSYGILPAGYPAGS